MNEGMDKPWYTEEDDEKLIENVELTVGGLVNDSADRLDRWDINEVLMQETRLDHFLGRTNEQSPTFQRRGTYQVLDGRLRYNIIRSIGDALKARIATSRPKVRFSTHAARFRIRQLARLNTKMMRGVISASNFYDISQQIFSDAFMYGIGFAKPFEVNGKVRIERVHPRCIFMDEPDYGNPTSWFQVEDVSKWELASEFDSFESEIEKSSVMHDLGDARDQKRSVDTQEIHGQDRCTVIEGWHVNMAGKGRHIILTNKVVLLDEPWDSELPGVIDFRFFEAAKGYIGQSYVDQLKEIQREINYILTKIQDHMNLGGTLKIFLDGSSRIAVDKLNNEHLQIVKYAGTRGLPLQVVQIPAVDKIYFEQIDRLEQKAYNLPGISELFATSEKPAGLESGKAMSTYENIQSARFLHIGQKWQSFFNKVGTATLDVLRNSGVKIKVGTVTLSGEDFSLGKNQFDVMPAVTSMLPDTPAGIIQSISDYAQMDPEIAADTIVLLEDLDLEAYLERILAPKLVVSKMVDEMLYDHKKFDVKPTMNLEYASRQATFATQQALLADDEVAESILAQFVADCDAMMTPEPMDMGGMPGAMPGMPPEGGMMPGMPGAAPGAAPGGEPPMPGPEDMTMPLV